MSVASFPAILLYLFAWFSFLPVRGQQKPGLRLGSILPALLGMAVYPLPVSAGFIAALISPAGIGPTAVAVGDFNGDGIPDLALADINTFSTTAGEAGSIMILLGNGDGTFQGGLNYPVGPQPTSLALGDFNRDGHLDVVVANTWDGTVTVLLGKGDGTFQAGQSSAVGSQPISVVLGDFNGDGYPDLAVANTGSGTVSILLGKGDGSFSAARNYAVGDRPTWVAVGDFNGDGTLDLAVTNYTQGGSVSILLGNGDGSFQAAVYYLIGGGPQSLVAGDLNEDGNLDIAVASFGSHPGPGSLSVLLGNGDGTFQPAATYAAGANPNCVAVGDFNRDGHLDLVMTCSGAARIWQGHGDGTFQEGPSYVNVGTGPLAVADLNRDGFEDLVVIDSKHFPDGLGAVSSLPGNGNGTFQAAPGYSLSKGTCGAVAVADFNGDGIADLAVAEEDGPVSTVVISFGNRDGTFRTGPSFAAGSGTVGIAVADFNGDGKQDLLLSNYYVEASGRQWYVTSDLRILLGNGDGTFQDAMVYKNGHGPPATAIGDFNGDGIPDLAIAYNGQQSNSMSIWLGNGDGTFQAGPLFPLSNGTGPCTVAVGDFDRDGKLDLIVAAASLSVLLGQGDGTFSIAHHYGLPGGYVTGLAVADFNGDGQLDVVVGAQPLNIFLGNGDGSFEAAKSYRSDGSPSGLAVGDFNGDGILDVAFTGGTLDAVNVSLGQGDGTFATAHEYSAGSVTGWIGTVDVNGDGKLDLAVANSATITILINDGNWPP